MDLEYEIQRLDEILVLDIKQRVEELFEDIQYYIKEKSKYEIPELTIEILKIDKESLEKCSTSRSEGMVENLQKKIEFLIKYSGN